MSSHSGRPASAMIKGQVLLCGNSHRELAQRVAQRLGIPLGACKLYQENCGETKIQIGESVRGKDVFIIQSGTRDPNNMMMELFILAYSCKTASAQRIVGVVPYLPYSKQCRMRKRGSIPCKLFANMMVKAGIQHLITMDLHMKEIQGFFSCPVDNLRASSFLIQNLKQEQSRLDNVVVVARHPGQARRATAYAERLRTSLSVIHGGEGVVLDTEATDGRSSPPLAAQLASTSQAQTPLTTVTATSVTCSSGLSDKPPPYSTDYDAPTDLSSFPKYYPKERILAKLEGGKYPCGRRVCCYSSSKVGCTITSELNAGCRDVMSTQHPSSSFVVGDRPSSIDLLGDMPLSESTTTASAAPGVLNVSHRVMQQQVCRVRSYSEGQRHSDVIEGEQDSRGLSVSPAGGASSTAGKGRSMRKLLDIRSTYRTEYMPSLTAKKKPPINVVGDVDGKIALIVEDIIDDVEGFCAAARFLKERGARLVKVMCTHGLLSENTIKTIESSDIDEVIITNTVPNDDLVITNNNNSKEYQALNSSSVKFHKITVVDVSVLLSEGIRRIHNGESMSYLFRDIALDD